MIVCCFSAQSGLEHLDFFFFRSISCPQGIIEFPWQSATLLSVGHCIGFHLNLGRCVRSCVEYAVLSKMSISVQPNVSLRLSLGRNCTNGTISLAGRVSIEICLKRTKNKGKCTIMAFKICFFEVNFFLREFLRGFRCVLFQF